MKEWLEARYEELNRRCYVHPDPLECLYAYNETADREIAALVAASLAYGQVRQILKSVNAVLSRMGPSPHAYLIHTSPARLQRDMAGFVHRFARDVHVSALLLSVQRILFEHGSLYQCFLAHQKASGRTVYPALCGFAAALREAGGCGNPGHLVACPEKGSACKRLNLFLRWMVRTDRVDPGGWEAVSPAALIIPLDTHMFRICAKLGLTSRRQADMKTALEITEGFRQWTPTDPVRYDFALTRLGIRKDLSARFSEYLN